MHKIKAVVKFNEGIAIVLQDKIITKANKHGNNIIESDGLFFSSLVYDRPSERWKAFAGRKFDIELEDGTVEHCTGQWWDGTTEKTKDIVGGDFISVTVCSIEELKKCYVFCGRYALKDKFEALLKTYTGKKYGYWEYDFILNGRGRSRANDRVDFRKKKNHRRFKKVIYR